MSKLILGPIIGGVSHKRANIWGRANGPGILHAWLGREPDLSDARLAAISLPLTEATGFAGVAPISGLYPDTRYHYKLALDDSDPDPTQAPFPHFTSFPLPGQPRPFSFAFGSCFRPDREEGGKIFTEIDLRRQQDDLRFCMLLGDQIYADDYNFNGLGKIPHSLEDYRQIYLHGWQPPPFREVLANLPAFMILDDHEVDDDWTWAEVDRSKAQIPVWSRVIRFLRRKSPWEWKVPAQRVRDALQAYWEHQGMHAPLMLNPPCIDNQNQYLLEPGDTGCLAYTFNFGAAAFFVLDTRTMRVKGRTKHTLLGKEQWLILERWLISVKDDFPLKFLVTSSSVLFNMWFDVSRDRWSGFPDEQRKLMHFLAVHGIEGVYFLAGDMHSGHAISAELYGPRGRPIPIWEFCSSPFEHNPNWLSNFGYSPIKQAPLKNQKVHFNIASHNFGVVRVDFEDHGIPRVTFDLYGRDGERLAGV
jgi:alkaline phosphatase D